MGGLFCASGNWVIESSIVASADGQTHWPVDKFDSDHPR